MFSMFQFFGYYIDACFGSEIRISYEDPDPGWPSYCGSGSETLVNSVDLHFLFYKDAVLWIRIQKSEPFEGSGSE